MAQIALPSIDYSVILQLLIIFGSATALLIVDLFVAAGSKRITALLAFAVTIVALVAGQYATIKMEYYENGGGAVAQLF